MADPFTRGEVLLQVHNLNVSYRTRTGMVSAVDDVSLDIYRGEILGLVGESGCGKSTLGKALMRMLPASASVTGQVIFNGRDVLSFDNGRLRSLRGAGISMIFQDPMTSLNPVQRVGDHLAEAVLAHESGRRTAGLRERIAGLVERLGIMRARLPDYPHQLSGGMRQRVMIGLGLVLNPGLIIADEATTSLDVIVAAKLLDQLREIREQYGLTIIVITHNIAQVAELADRVAVMYAGRIAEVGSVYDVFDGPRHPYTRGLLRSVPSIKLEDREELYKMPGEPPSLMTPPVGCRFHPRCPEAMPVCSQVAPDLLPILPGHLVNCWLYQEQPEQAAPGTGQGGS
jgi:oligopeptide/dipeptide ABC transporter ATP-binding protein